MLDLRDHKRERSLPITNKKASYKELVAARKKLLRKKRKQPSFLTLLKGLVQPTKEKADEPVADKSAIPEDNEKAQETPQVEAQVETGETLPLDDHEVAEAAADEEDSYDHDEELAEAVRSLEEEESEDAQPNESEEEDCFEEALVAAQTVEAVTETVEELPISLEDPYLDEGVNPALHEGSEVPAEEPEAIPSLEAEVQALLAAQQGDDDEEESASDSEESVPKEEEASPEETPPETSDAPPPSEEEIQEDIESTPETPVEEAPDPTADEPASAESNEDDDRGEASSEIAPEEETDDGDSDSQQTTDEETLQSSAEEETVLVQTEDDLGTPRHSIPEGEGLVESNIPVEPELPVEAVPLVAEPKTEPRPRKSVWDRVLERLTTKAEDRPLLDEREVAERKKPKEEESHDEQLLPEDSVNHSEEATALEGLAGDAIAELPTEESAPLDPEEVERQREEELREKLQNCPKLEKVRIRDLRRKNRLGAFYKTSQIKKLLTSHLGGQKAETFQMLKKTRQFDYILQG